MANDLRSSAPGEFGSMRLAAATIGFADSAVAVDSLAVGDVVIRVWAEVLTVFNAGTTNVLTVDDGNTANKYLGAADVTEGTVGVYPTGGAGPFKAEPTARTLTAKFAQTGTAATTGSARVYALISSSAV
jgi:hypothetical protein